MHMEKHATDVANRLTVCCTATESEDPHCRIVRVLLGAPVLTDL